MRYVRYYISIGNNPGSKGLCIYRRKALSKPSIDYLDSWFVDSEGIVIKQLKIKRRLQEE